MLTAAFTIAVVSANGQSIRAVAQIPFDFVIGDKVLPAGEYTVNAMTQDGSVLRIHNDEAGQAATRVTNTVIAKSSRNSKSRLIFHRYGQTYFLAEVWREGDSEGRLLQQSKKERSMRHELGALAQTKCETVELVAMLR